MNVYGRTFTYNGTNSSAYDVVLCSFERPDNITETAIKYTINKSEITPNKHIVNMYNRKYDDVLKFEIGICKPDGKPFERVLRQEIVGWITSPNIPALLHVDDFDEDDYHLNIDYFCLCTGYKEFNISGKINGLIFEMECNAPFGFSTEEITKFDINGSGDVFITNTSDEWEHVYYPVLELVGKSTGLVTIVNNLFPDDIMELKIKNGQSLFVNNQNGDIYDNIGLFDYENDTNLKWLRLKHGENVISITGDVKGCIKCRYIRKVAI